MKPDYKSVVDAAIGPKTEKDILNKMNKEELNLDKKKELIEIIQEIEKGVLFKNLPQDYCCSLCESPKINFIALTAEKLNTP